MKIALVCIAKDEDHYIDEWIDYHLKLGFTDVYVYQNNWRYAGAKTNDVHVHWIEFDGEMKQLEAYNSFIDNHWQEYAFAAFIDVDEYVVVNSMSLEDYLSQFSENYGIALNWKLFGDNGLNNVVDGDYSCVKRFTKCQSGFNKHIKTVLNLRMCQTKAKFVTPHNVGIGMQLPVICDADNIHRVIGPFNEVDNVHSAWLNHYFCKTQAEYTEIKITRGRADTLDPAKHPQFYRTQQEFDEHNFNDDEDTTAKDFFIREQDKKTTIWYTALLATGWQDIFKKQLGMLKSAQVFSKVNKMKVFAYPRNLELLDLCKGLPIEVKFIKHNMYEFPALLDMWCNPDDINMYFHMKGVSYKDEPTRSSCIHWGDMLLKVLVENFDTIVNDLKLKKHDVAGSLFRQFPFDHFSGNFFMTTKDHLKQLKMPDISDRMNAEKFIASIPGKYLSLFNNGYRDMHKEQEDLNSLKLNPLEFTTF